MHPKVSAKEAHAIASASPVLTSRHVKSVKNASLFIALERLMDGAGTA